MGYGVMVCVWWAVCGVWRDGVCVVGSVCGGHVCWGWRDGVCVVGMWVYSSSCMPTEYRKSLKRQWMVQLTSFLLNRFASHSVTMYCLHFPLSECIYTC